MGIVIKGFKSLRLRIGYFMPEEKAVVRKNHQVYLPHAAYAVVC
jgi:hypothetical protein